MSGLSRVPHVDALYQSVYLDLSDVCLLSNTPAFLKNGNFLSHHENSKKPNNYCNDGDRWKCNGQFLKKSKSRVFFGLVG